MSTGIWCLKINFSNSNTKSENYRLLFFYSKEDAEKRLKKEEFWFLSENFQFVDKINIKTNEKITNYTGNYEDKYQYLFYNNKDCLFTNEDLYNRKIQNLIFEASIFKVHIELD